MNPAIYLLCFLPLLIALLEQSAQRKAWAARRAARPKKKGAACMTELINRYIGKECIVYTMNSQVSGTIREVWGGWVSIETAGAPEALNLDYIVRIREYPRRKNGKKKAAVLD